MPLRKRKPVQQPLFVSTAALHRQGAGKPPLVEGKTVGVDSTALEANAAMRSIMRRETASGIERWKPEPTCTFGASRWSEWHRFQSVSRPSRTRRLERLDRWNSPEPEPIMSDTNAIPIDSQTRIGHVHLKVADLERAIAFYHGVLGFAVTERWGTEAAFLSAGGYHHHIAVNTWQNRGGTPPPRDTTGLYHFAILYSTRASLADALRRLLKAGVPLDGAADHGVSEALYLRDPDGNGVELYRDRPREEWPQTPDGRLAMSNDPLDLNDLLTEDRHHVR